MAILEGKTALVTGGSRGIGRAIALELARQGADVAVNYARNAEAATQVVTDIEALGRRAVALRADVGDFDQAAALVEAAVNALGRLDILVNNAGITRDTLLLRMQEADWDEVLRVNLKGAFNTGKAAVRLMVRQRAGRIINVSSVSGLVGQVGQANYSASKAGIIGLTKSMAREFAARGITVNAIAPGLITTDMTAALDEGLREQMRALIPLGRFGTTEDVAHAVVFLASDAAAYITGAVLSVDGGLSM
jgi:3-oxoacyl-[acyl-carrier protein] reductase